MLDAASLDDAEKKPRAQSAKPSCCKLLLERTESSVDIGRNHTPLLLADNLASEEKKKKKKSEVLRSRG